ncbi:sensor histidine kinase [Phytoactinopolyspora halotolerans]|uniref:histidine kinase n=1 Tax=Phytoactinopolyspora halotolerans TaxID=1981512 RepID=A0A6L9S8U3_9ACTN|nr:sensor histidine kinase [Phytoactinopolyspora halotolerans]NEE01487.1 sensor histidine kinase [Phytoactinopolyspora halotolerans]
MSARQRDRVRHGARSRVPGRRRRSLSLAQQLFALQLVLVLLLVVAGGALAYVNARRESEAEAGRRALALAHAMAELPEVRGALDDDDPSGVLQPLAESVRAATGTDFIVFMDTDRTRYSHPTAEQIGERFIGTVEPAVAGESLTETYQGTLGPSVRAVVPIYAADTADAVGSVDAADRAQPAALVSVGILQERIWGELRRRLSWIVVIAVAALGVAALGSFAISRRLDRQTLGLGAVEITRMYEHHEAVLHAVREGLLVIDTAGRLILANDEAVELLGLPEDRERKTIRELGLSGPLADVLTSGEAVEDRLHVHGDRVLVVSQQPTFKQGRHLGSVVTLRDHTELEALSGELESERGFADALRAQAHEAANRLHTVVTMVEMGEPERAVEFATAELQTSQQLTDQVTGSVTEPALAAVLLGKAAQAHQNGVAFTVSPETSVDDTFLSPRELVTLVGNLADNAIDAAVAAPPPRRVSVTIQGDDELVVRVTDSGPGLAAEHLDDALSWGWSTKDADHSDGDGAAVDRSPRVHGRGLGLALVGQIVHRYGGTVEVEPRIDDGGESAIVVRLPRQAEGAAAALVRPPAGRHVAARPILPGEP